MQISRRPIKILFGASLYLMEKIGTKQRIPAFVILQEYIRIADLHLLCFGWPNEWGSVPFDPRIYSPMDYWVRLFIYGWLQPFWSLFSFIEKNRMLITKVYH